MRLRAVLGDEIGSALAASLVLAAVEAVAVRDGGAAWVGVALLLGLGSLVGITLLGVGALVSVAGPRLRPLPAAAVHAAAALPALIFVAAHLFDGSRAATLPGAGSAWLWAPLLGWALLALAIWIGGRLLTRRSRAIRAALIGALVIGAAVIDVANRRLHRSEYPEVHAFLVVVALAMLAVAARAACVGIPAGPHRSWWRLGALAAVAVGVGLALWRGLDSADSRWAIATRGTDVRELTRLTRALFDRDGDRAAPVLGGGDCDDGDPAINPGAAEIPGNGIDEDCDGVDLAVDPAAVRRDLGELRAELRARPEVSALLGATRGMSLVVIAIDALRADAVADTVANRAAFPNLFGLFDRSRRFDRAFASAAATDLSVASVLTGRFDPFGTVERTLPEALQASGRRTRAIFPSEVLRHAGQVLLGRGIERTQRYVNDGDERDVGKHTTAITATDWAVRDIGELAGGDVPLYLWLHYFDIHEHHQIERTDRNLVGIPGAGVDASAVEHYRALLALTDRQIGRVVAAITAAGAAERTIIVVLSDHGESLGEDPRLPETHGSFVYNALVHVPLALVVPGVVPARIDAPMSLVDLAPTLLELLGAPPLPAMDGVSQLAQLVDGAPAELRAEPRTLVFHEEEQWAVIAWPLKLLVRPADNLIELYDLEHDFAERTDLAAQRPDDVSRLKARFAGFSHPLIDRTSRGRRLRDEQSKP